ncbi:hypothetical protein Tco_0770833 [Tanacetum coccineum]|uniref:Uncharacterized protein n=1 Tax=Tanacetum coccineum TaxID=301880 RepID=A0ABQ4ZGV3_9ASTR
MSSASSAVTYTSVYTDSEPGGVSGLSESSPLHQTGDHLLLESPDMLLRIKSKKYPRRVLRMMNKMMVPVTIPMDGKSIQDDDDGENRAFTTHHQHRTTDITTTGARITVRPQDSISFPPEAEVERLLAIPTPPPSPLISLSPPFAGERLTRCTAPSAHSSPPPVPSPLLPSSGCPTQTLLMRYAALPSTGPPPPLPPYLYIPPLADRRDDIPRVPDQEGRERPPRKSIVDAKARRHGISKVGYGIRDTWVDPAEATPEIAPMTVGEVNTRVTELVGRLTYGGYDDSLGDGTHCGGGGLCFPKGFGSCDKIESCDTATAAEHSYSDTTPGRVVSTARSIGGKQDKPAPSHSSRVNLDASMEVR